MITSTFIATAQNQIKLVAPSVNGGLSIMESFWQRHSDREFSAKDITDQDLSDLLFAASGINRQDEEKLTAPSALNKQEIDVYVFSTEGVYKYVPKGHMLEQVVKGDYRKLIAGTPEFSQDFVLQAPISLVLVANPQKFDNVNQQSVTMAVADAGIMAENICLFCAGKGLSTVPRATMNSAAIAKLLSLPADAFAVLNLPVGYPKQ